MGKSSPNTITVRLDDKVIRDLRRLQSKVIRKSGRGCSFSKIINVVAGYEVGEITLKEAILKLGLVKKASKNG